MEKPKDYQPGGQEALNNVTKKNIIPLLLLLTIGVWLVTSICVSVKDIFGGFKHPVLSTSFIISSITIVTGIVLGYVRKNGVKIFSIKKQKSDKPCTKCGKNKTKK